MGYSHEQIEIHAVLDAHHDERTERDRMAWEVFCQEVRALSKRPEFGSLRLVVYCAGADD